MKIDLKKIKSVVLGSLGLKDFEKNTEGKVVLSDDQKGALDAGWMPGFAEKFLEHINAEEGSEGANDASAAIEALFSEFTQDAVTGMEQKVNAAKIKADEERKKRIKLEGEKAVLEADKVALQKTVSLLSDLGDDVPEKVIGKKSASSVTEEGPWLGVKVNAKSFHNRMASDYMVGKTGLLMASSSSSFVDNTMIGQESSSINVDELYTEFGTYLSNTAANLAIKHMLTAKTKSQEYMTTKMAITEYRAAKGVITNVVQQYIAKWTPLGDSTFTPLTIKNRRHKINVGITPDDINDSWLSYLYDEQLTPDQMPVTRYIIEKMLRPKIEENIELLLIATGVYEELSNVNEGDAGQTTGKSMDGYITLLNSMAESETTKANFWLPSMSIEDGGIGEVLSDENIVDAVEAYSDWLEDKAPLYAKAGMNIFIDPKLYKKFKRKYRELYVATKNEDANKDTPDFSNLTFVPLEAMRGTGVWFSTPKDNFIRLIHKNAAGAETKLNMQVHNYEVRVFGEFWLGVGFLMEELVFAYTTAYTEPVASGSGE